jgi:putative ABC transport system permease protein
MMEYLRFSVLSMAERKARTVLTLLGIIIGIAVIVAMVSIGSGMQASISQQLERLGAEKISVLPPGGIALPTGPPVEYAPFTRKELMEIKKIQGVRKAVPHFYRGVTLEYGSEKAEVVLMGDNAEGARLWMETGFYEVERGRFYRPGDPGVVVLWSRAARKLFDREVPIGARVKVNGENLEVVGVLKEYGDRVMDEGIYVPIETAWSLFDTKDISAIFVKAESEEVVDEVAARIEDYLEKERGGKDFEVLTTRQLAEQIGRITKIVTFILGGIASVSILVGGIIVMNTMLMAVMERTREIGVMKATGASNSQVLGIFLAESSVMGFVGGALGVLLGTALSKVIHYMGRSYLGSSFMTLVSPELVAGVLAFSVLIGVLSGLYPAWRAANLDPAEDLRYE